MTIRRLAATLAAAALVLAGTLPLAPGAAALDGVTEVCRFPDPRFDEISGMTYSQLHPGVVYLHNDSGGGPRIYAVDATTCRTLATLTLAGIPARDIEAIGSGRDRAGRPILWVGDIGDNNGVWPEVRLHRVREPQRLVDQTMPVRTYRFTYPDGPVNAEALLTDPRGRRVWVVGKQLAASRIYRVPLTRGQRAVAQPVGDAGGLVTDGSVSPDGSRFALRDYVDAQVRTGLPPGSDPQTVYLPMQPQGEAMTWTPDGRALLVAGERDDRLLRVDVVAAPTAASPSAVPSPSPSPSGAPSPSSSGERRPSAQASTGPASTTPREGGAGAGPIVLAGVLVAGALLVIAIAEWRRRRPGAPRG